MKDQPYVKGYRSTISAPPIFMTQYFDTQKKEFKGWVKDALESEVDKWKTEDFIFVTSPTGSGKNTFVRDCILPKAKRENKRVLLLSNRSALDKQQRLDIANLYNEYPKSMLELENENASGMVLTASYQQMIDVFQNPQKHSEYFYNIGYVIIDEAHFFIADSCFNPYTEFILSNIVAHYSTCAIRIYLTATPYRCYNSILECEKQYFNVPPIHNRPRINSFSVERNKYIYESKANYDNFNFFFFDDWSIIIDKIQSNYERAKWLIFIRDKDQYSTIKKDVNQLNRNITFEYVDSDTKNTNTYMNLLKYSRFESRVLIATSAIDNGVNIKDAELKNIVIDTTDSVSALQMLGRKRCLKDETVNVFIRIPTDKEIGGYLGRLNEMARYINEYKASPAAFARKNWGTFPPYLQQIFIPVDAYGNINYGVCVHFYLNGLAEKEIGYQIEELSNLKNLYDNKIPNAFERTALKWFEKNKEDFDKKMIVQIDVEGIKAEILTLIQNHMKNMERAEANLVVKDFLRLVKRITKGKYSSSFAKAAQEALDELNLPYIFDKETISKTETSDKYEYWFFKHKDAVSSSKQSEETSSEITEQTDEKQKSETADAPILSQTETPKKRRGRPKKVSNS